MVYRKKKSKNARKILNCYKKREKAEKQKKQEFQGDSERSDG